ncbi:MAG: RNA polymerase sigma-70 factor [Chitinophagaceae bacterium]|nr:RNA polymerase sigma-70 factor [Chitinophagaceae bacterium]
MEEELLRKIAEADEKAFARLVAHYAPIIYAHILSYIKDPQQSEEITQDIFVGIWNVRTTLPDIVNFRAYIFRATRNRTITALRQQLSHESLAGRDEWEDTLSNPAEKMELRELNQVIMAGIELLPPRRQQVFKMSRLQGLSYDEIAAELNISKSAVNQHIVESLVFLRTHLKGKLPLWIHLFLPLALLQ